MYVNIENSFSKGNGVGVKGLVLEGEGLRIALDPGQARGRVWDVQIPRLLLPLLQHGAVDVADANLPLQSEQKRSDQGEMKRGERRRCEEEASVRTRRSRSRRTTHLDRVLLVLLDDVGLLGFPDLLQHAYPQAFLPSIMLFPLLL